MFIRSLLVGHYYVGIKKEKNTLCNELKCELISLVFSCPTWSKCMPVRFFYTSCAGKHGRWYKTNFVSLKAVLTFQTLILATLGKWATTGFFSWQELFLDFAAWIDLTSNADNLLLYQLRWKLQNTFCFFKTCWWLTGLSRLYDAHQPPGRLQGT